MKVDKNTISNVDVSHFKRTKIIATIGPACDSYEQVYGLIKNGANGIRFNFSHGDNESRIKQLKWVKKASRELAKPVALIQDLQGPKIRLGDFEGAYAVHKGQSISLRYQADLAREGVLPIQYDLSSKVKRGERLYLYDGRIKTVISSVQDKIIHLRVENDGILISRKGINLPDTNFGGDILTDKDLSDLSFGVDHDFDYVALSFVQSYKDVENLQIKLRNLGSKAKVIAKIETKAALDNIEAIVSSADATMVARGDLAVETEPEVVPVAQRRIIGLGHKYSKPTIVATQMLASMTDNPEPTRAEVSDVATAVMLGVDAVMLSDETASGKYPLEAVTLMKKVITYTESNQPLKVEYNQEPVDKHSKAGSISDAILSLSASVKAVAIVAETKSGATALNIASRRPSVPIIAVTSDEKVARQLAILYGCKSFVRRDERLQSTKLTDWLLKQKILFKGDFVVIAYGSRHGVIGATDTIKVRYLE